MAITDKLGDALNWFTRTPEGIFTAGAIPLGLSAWQAIRPQGRLPSMSAPQPALDYSTARSRASAALDSVYDDRIKQRLQQQANQYASRGLYGQMPADALMTEALATVENARASEEAALAQGMVGRDLQRFLAEQALYYDYMLRRRQVEEQRRNNLINSLIGIFQAGLKLYDTAGRMTGQWPFSGGRWTPEAAAGAVEAGAGYLNQIKDPRSL